MISMKLVKPNTRFPGARESVARVHRPSELHTNCIPTQTKARYMDQKLGQCVSVSDLQQSGNRQEREWLEERERKSERFSSTLTTMKAALRGTFVQSFRDETGPRAREREKKIPRERTEIER